MYALWDLNEPIVLMKPPEKSSKKLCGSLDSCHDFFYLFEFWMGPHFAVFLLVRGSQGEIIKTDQSFNDRFTYRLQSKRLLWRTLYLETALLETEVSILVKLRFPAKFRSGCCQ